VGQVPKARILEEPREVNVLVPPQQDLPQILQEAGTAGLPFVPAAVGGIADLTPCHRRADLLFGPGDVAGAHRAPDHAPRGPDAQCGGRVRPAHARPGRLLAPRSRR
jgi:hypothetical protein